MLLALAAARRALIVRNSSAFHEGDYLNPIVGLDTTGRERLWKLAIAAVPQAYARGQTLQVILRFG